MTERTKQLAEELTRLHFENPIDITRLGSMAPARGEDRAVICLYTSGSALLAGELGDQIGLSTGRIANILRQLEVKGLISRFHDELDRRRVHVSLTDEGRKYAGQLEANTVKAHAKLLEQLGSNDAKELVRIVRRCITYVHNGSS